MEKFEAFLENSTDVVNQVENNLIEDRKMGRKDFPCWGLPKDSVQQDILTNNWKTWHP
jgi:hypothetical protein